MNDLFKFYLKYFLFVFFMVFFDQLVKFLVYININESEIYNFGCFNDIISICHVCNSGLAFNLFSDYSNIKFFIIIFRVIVLYFLFKQLLKECENEYFKYKLFGILFIFCGGISNTLDLFFYGTVIDVLCIKISNIFNLTYDISFNFADAYVILGIVLLFYYSKKMRICSD